MHVTVYLYPLGVRFYNLFLAFFIIFSFLSPCVFGYFITESQKSYRNKLKLIQREAFFREDLLCMYLYVHVCVCIFVCVCVCVCV